MSLVQVPYITSVEQLSENSIRIKWLYPGDDDDEAAAENKHFTRYRIQYSTDGFEDDIGEWPGMDKHTKIKLQKLI